MSNPPFALFGNTQSNTNSLFGNSNNPFSNSNPPSNSNPFFSNNPQNSLFGFPSSVNQNKVGNSLNLFGDNTPDNEIKDKKNENPNPFPNIFSGNRTNTKDVKKQEEKDIFKEKNPTNNIFGGSLFGNNEKKDSLFNSNNNNNNNLFFNNNLNNNPLFSSSTPDKKKEEGLFVGSSPFKNDKNEVNNSLFNINEKNNKKDGIFPDFNNKDNNGKIFFINNKEEETPMTEQKNEKDIIKINTTNKDYNPFKNNETHSPKKESSNIFNVADDKNNYSDNLKINDNNNIFSDKNKNIINIEEMKDNKVSYPNNEFVLENNNEEKQENEEQEMELDEEEKKDISSINSDIINNLWISDNEEIIDDDIDINKKIDYKKLEEKLENKVNKLNDLNLLILPELSEYYFEKSKTISDYYTFSDSNIRDKFSIEISRKIIDILKSLIKNSNFDEEKESELINITTIYIYFDAFILHRNDVIYLMKLRDDLLYRYYIPSEILINFENKNKNIIYNKENNNINSIISIMKKIYFHLTMLDIDKAYQQMNSLNQIYENIYRNKIFGDKSMKFKDLFMNIEKIIKIYNNIYSLKENFNSKQIISSFNMISVFQEVVEIIKEMQYEKESMNENIKKIFIECQKIIGIITGNVEYLVNEYNQNNIHLLIIGNIFYRFYKNDFIKVIGDCLISKKKELNLEEDLTNKIILTIIKNCDQNQIEIVQELKGNYPFLLRYHMIEILSQNAFLFQVENQEKYLKKEAFLLFQNFKDLKIPFKYHLNYISFYPNYEIFNVENVNDIDNLEDDSSDELKEKGYRNALDYALIYINSRFKNEDNVEVIKNEIDDIKNEIGNKIIDTYSNDILYKINKLCLIKYNERNVYKYSILSYIENYNIENKDLKKLQIRQERNQLCADNEFNYDYPKQLDKVIINFYLNTNYIFNQTLFKDTYEKNKLKVDQDFKEVQDLLSILLTQKEQFSIDNNIQFIINYSQFLLDVMRYNLNSEEKNNKYNVNIVLTCKKFFNDCFPLPKCPVFLWYHILMSIKNVIDENIEQFSNDIFLGENAELCEDLSIWDKKLIYEIIKVEKIKGKEINIENANIMYENAFSFVNDISQGFYFNQNIFNSKNFKY